MIHHHVFLSLQSTADQVELSAVMVALSDLVGQIDGFSTFNHGPNIDLERKSPEAAYGFTCVFTDQSALTRYSEDPRHQALGARLVALCGSADRIKVYDIDDGGS